MASGWLCFAPVGCLAGAHSLKLPLEVWLWWPVAGRAGWCSSGPCCSPSCGAPSSMKIRGGRFGRASHCAYWAPCCCIADVPLGESHPSSGGSSREPCGCWTSVAPSRLGVNANAASSVVAAGCSVALRVSHAIVGHGSTRQHWLASHCFPRGSGRG